MRKLHPKPEPQQGLRILVAFIVAVDGCVRALGAQTHSLDASYGAWRSDTIAILWSAGLTRRLLGPLDLGLALTHLDDRASPLDRTQTGGEFSLAVGRDGSGPYVLGAAGLAVKHRGGGLESAWSAGGGVSARLLPFLALGIEGRYRAEDQFNHGFWRLDPSDRTGWLVVGRVSVLLHRAGRKTRRVTNEVPSPTAVERAARRSGLSRSELAAQIVNTALEAMGTPYRWGGDDSNGYDCSGLIQFAYGEHGILLPRRSRDQAEFGRRIDRSIDRLAPGDILGFSVEGDRVTHVGLYVGGGQFIHSATGGVKLSSLTDSDPDSSWWRRRWASAGRVLD